jgi:hypothetical protein
MGDNKDLSGEFSGVFRVTQAILDAQRVLRWPDMHPEDFCHRCYGRNISWWTDSDVWNLIMRPDGPDSPWLWHEIICPQCFAELVETRFPLVAWHVYMDENTRGAKAIRAALPLPDRSTQP